MIDDDGQLYHPATSTKAIVHPDSRQCIENLFSEYDMSSLYDLHSLEACKTKLGEDIPLGTKIFFTTDSGILQRWEYWGSGVWKEIDYSVIQEISKAVWPIVYTFSANPKLIQVGRETTVKFSWTALRKNEDLVGKEGTTILLDNIGVSGKSKEISYTPTKKEAVEHILTIIDPISSVSTTLQVNSAYPSYYGVPGETPVEVLTGGKGYTVKNQTLNNQKLVYKYDASYGNLTSIKDSNGFDYLNSYTLTTEEINGITYNVYTLTDPTTISDFNQIFA